MVDEPTVSLPEEVLADRGWLIRIAQGLVGDRDKAEDVVQDTWIAAIERPEGESAPSRGWLRRVVRNLVGERIRRDARRAHREELAASHDAAAPSHEALLERMELQRIVAEEVTKLSEPYRSTVILRFADDLQPAEIARRLGLPPGTVRRRLKHGLDELRERLDRRFGGDRRSWVGGLALVLTGSTRGGRSAAGGAGLRLVAVLFGSVALVGAVRSFALPVEPLAHPPEIAAEGAGAAHGPDVSESLDGARPSPIEREALRHGQRGSASGRDVVWIDGVVEPPADCAADDGLEAFVLDEPQSYAEFVRASTLSPPSATAAGWRVAPDGTFRVPLERGSVGYLMLRGERAYTPFAVAVRAVERVEPVHLTPEVGGILRGRVAARDGPLADTELRLCSAGFGVDPSASNEDPFLARVRTSESGDFEFPAVPIGRQMQVYVLPAPASELGGVRVVADALSACDERAIDLVLEPGGSLEGAVQDASGAPVAAARVECLLAGGWASLEPMRTRETVSDASGRFVLDAVPNEPVILRASKRGFVETKVQCDPADHAARTRSVLVLRAGREISGHVVFEDGRPASNALVRVESDPFWSGPFVEHALRDGTEEARCDESGRFEVVGLGAGLLCVSAESEADGAVQRACLRGLRGDSSDGHELVLRPLAALHGRAVDAHGDPVTRFELDARGIDSGGAVVAREHLLVDDEGGRFALEGLERGVWLVRAIAPALVCATSVRVELWNDVADLELELVPSASVEGVVRGSDGVPSPGARVLADGGEWSRSTTAERDGRFSLSGLAPGRVALSAAAEQGVSSARPSELELSPGEVRTGVEVVLPSHGALVGRVLGRDGAGLGGGPYLQLADARRATSQVDRADEDGSFRFEHLEPGTWSISVALIGGEVVSEESIGANTLVRTASDRIRTYEQSVWIEAGGTSEVTFRDGDPSEIRVEGVVLRSGQPHASAWVTFMPHAVGRAADFRHALADANGSFEVELPRGGFYTIHVDQFPKDPNDSRKVEFVRAIADTPLQRIELELPRGSIEGRVLRPDGSPAAGVRVSSNFCGQGSSTGSSGGLFVDTLTDPNGFYVFHDLWEGEYELFAGGPRAGSTPLAGREPRTVFGPLAIEAGEQVAGIDLALADDACRLSVRVLDADGVPAQGATLFVRDEAGRVLEPVSRITTDSRGRADYGPVAPGRYTLFAISRDRASRESAPVDATAQDLDAAAHELVLAPATLLLVEYAGATGSPVRGWIDVRDAQGRRVDGIHAQSEYRGSVLRGVFSPCGAIVGPLPPGAYSLRFRPMSAGSETSASLWLAGEPERRITLRPGD